MWQVTIIIDLWNKSNGYPVALEPMYMGESVVDETAEYLSQLSEDITGLVKDVFRYLFK